MVKKKMEVWVISLLGLALLISGCGTGISRDYESMGAKPNISTYSWQPTTVNDSRINTSHLDAVVMDAVNKELTAKGYALDTAEQPTFLTSYQADITEKATTVTLDGQVNEQIANYIGGSEYSIPKTKEITYDQGTLVLNFCSVDNPSIYWRGSAKAKVSLTDSQATRDRMVCNAVKEIMTKFPTR